MSAEGPLDGANFHCRAASRANLPKNWLGAAESRSAEETEPSGFTLTRTLIRTVPRIVERALSDTLGKTLCITEVEPATGTDSDRDGWIAGRVGVFLAAAGGANTGGAGAVAVAGGLVVVGAVAFFSADREVAAGAGCEFWLPGLLGGAAEVVVRGVSRRNRGTTSAATTRVAAAPITKYFSEPRETRGSAARRFAPIVTFT